MEELIRGYAKQLRLPYTYQNIEHHLQQARIENPSYEEFLLNLLRYEGEMRAQNGIMTRIRTAKFPYQKYLEELHLDALPTQAQDKFQILSSLEFIGRKQNIILAGNPGTGKTHLSIALESRPARKDIMCILPMFQTSLLSSRKLKVSVFYRD